VVLMMPEEAAVALVLSENQQVAPVFEMQVLLVRRL
jgi:hypothetical protein